MKRRKLKRLWRNKVRGKMRRIRRTFCTQPKKGKQFQRNLCFNPYKLLYGISLFKFQISLQNKMKISKKSFSQINPINYFLKLHQKSNLQFIFFPWKAFMLKRQILFHNMLFSLRTTTAAPESNLIQNCFVPKIISS